MELETVFHIVLFGILAFLGNNLVRDSIKLYRYSRQQRMTLFQAGVDHACRMGEVDGVLLSKKKYKMVKEQILWG